MPMACRPQQRLLWLFWTAAGRLGQGEIVRGPASSHKASTHRGRVNRDDRCCSFLFQLGTGTCYDESDNCHKIAKDGGCASSDMHKLGNYCKKSCGLCGKYSRKKTYFLLPYLHSTNCLERRTICAVGQRLSVKLFYPSLAVNHQISA